MKYSFLIVILILSVLLFSSCSGVNGMQKPVNTPANPSIQTSSTASEKDTSPLPYAPIPTLSPMTREDAENAFSGSAMRQAVSQLIDARGVDLENAMLSEVFSMPQLSADGEISVEGTTWNCYAYTDSEIVAHFWCTNSEGIVRIEGESYDTIGLNTILQTSNTNTIYFASVLDESGTGGYLCILSGDGRWYDSDGAPLLDAVLDLLPEEIDISSLPSISLDEFSTPSDILKTDITSH